MADNQLIPLSQLHKDLPGLRGYSETSLKKMRLFYILWNLSSRISNARWEWQLRKILNKEAKEE